VLDLLTLDELFHSLSFFLYINLCLFFSSVVASFLSLFLSLSQFWLFSKTGEIRRDEACLDYAGTDVILYPCHGAKGNQYWEYDPTTNYVQHGSSKNCLAISEDKKKITVEKCSQDNPRVQWKFQKYNDAKKL